MAYRSEDEKTTVFTFGNLAYEGAAVSHAQKYAPQEMPRVAAERVPSRSHILLVVTAVLAVALSVLLFVAALMGQARLTELNDQAVSTAREIGELRREQTELRVRYEETFDLETIENYATVTLGMQKPGNDQFDFATPAVPDQVTVLAKENGLSLSSCWSAILDTLGACFH